MRPAVLPADFRLLTSPRWTRWFRSPLFALGLAMAGLVLLVPPAGEFPIDIDWNYSWVVQSLLEGRPVAVSPWTASSLVLQVYWGGLFATLFGYSQTVLRLSTLVMAAAATFGMYCLLREMLERQWALLGALLLLFNPLFVPLAYTFKTNVPLLAFAMWALYCHVRALRGKQPDLRWVVAGSLLAGGAYLVRQIGIALPPAVLIAMALSMGWRCLRPRLLLAVLGPFALAVLVGTYFDQLRGPVKQDPVAWMVAFWGLRGTELIGLIVGRVVGAFTTLGLFTLPLSIGVLTDRSRVGLSGWQRPLVVELPLAMLAGLVAGSLAFGEWPLFPYLGDTLSRRGFFVENRSYHDATVPVSILVPDPVLLLVTVAAFLGGVLLLLAAVKVYSLATLRGPAGVPLLFGLIALSLSLVYHTFHDDYLLAVLPIAMLAALLAFRTARWSHALALGGVAIVAFWSIWWERDLLERETAVWQAGRLLTERGISADQIDGGFAWNGWYRGQAVIAAAIERTADRGPGMDMQDYIFQGLHMQDAPWVVAFEQPANPSTDTILVVVPYGNGHRVLGVQRY